MIINNLYPKNEEDKIFKRVQEYVKKHYPYVKVKNIRISKTLINVTTYYGQIRLQKENFI